MTRRVDRATAFVVLIFGLALGTAAAFLLQHGTRLGMLEDLTEVEGHLDGSVPSWGWFWTLHNEHRIPLPRILHWVCLRATRDFRTATWIELGLLACAALACIVAARRIRGRTLAVDAVFPLFLLSLAGAENLLNGFQICFVLPVALIVFVLASIATVGAAVQPRSVWMVAIGLALLPFCGLVGVLPVPWLAAWLSWIGWRAWRRADRRVAFVSFAGAAAGILAAVLVSVGFHLRAGFESPSIGRTVVVALQFLSTAAGRVGESTWPWSGVAAGVALLGCAAWLAIVARREPGSRERSLGLLAIACGVGAIALAVGYGRGSEPETAGFSSRYAMLASLMPCLVFLAATTRSTSCTAGIVQIALLVAAAVAFVANNGPALEYGRARSDRALRTQTAVEEGLAYSEISRPGVPDVFNGVAYHSRTLLLLDFAGLPPFERAPGPDPLLLLGRDPADQRFHGPEIVRGPVEPSERIEGGHIVLAAHADTELEWAMPSGARTLRGRFAVPERLWQRSLGDGTRFDVEIRTSAGALLAREEYVLFPVTRPEDRGFHDFGLLLPAAGEPRRIVLRVSSVDPPSGSAAWGLWSDVRAR